jgi:DNA-binding GntR family transcriptional regulator
VFERRDAERAELLMKAHLLEALDMLVTHVTDAGGMGAATAQQVAAG